MKHFRKVLSFHLLLLPALFLAPMLTGCGTGHAPASRTSFAYDTAITVTIYDSLPEKESAEILDGCVQLAEELDHRYFSAHDEHSEIWRANHGGGEQVPISRMTCDLLVTSLYWAGQTENAFLPTLGTLTELWNFTGVPPGPVPDSARIREALEHTSVKSVNLEAPDSSGTGNIIHAEEETSAADADQPAAYVSIDDPGLMLDLGGIAKGYAADRLKEYLEDRGVSSAVINLGGNVLLVGSRPDGSDFQVGIQDPGTGTAEAVTGQTLFSVPASDVSIVTSGIYERYFEENGVRYHHILDPQTGYPADSGLSSVTVISPDSASGDALATALLVMGAEKGQELMEHLPDMEALFITGDGEILKTSGFPELITAP
ncbi:MAG: FAD:protein FMN transferase [Lachnospiraceae bacterium]|nr:FAD:protein FMN transferase [Lachnospiraceae bacterium]